MLNFWSGAKKAFKNIHSVLPFTSQVWHNVSPFILCLSCVDAIFKKKYFSKYAFIHVYAVYLIGIMLYAGLFEAEETALKSVFKMLPLVLVPFLFSVTQRATQTGVETCWKALILGATCLALIVGTQFLSGVTVENIYIHRPYFGFFSALAVLWCFFFYEQTKQRRYVAVILLLVMVNLLIVPRLGIGNIMLLLLYFGLVKRGIKMNRKVLVIAAIGLVALVALNFSSLKERFYDGLKNEPRLAIWKSTYEVTQNDAFNPVFGYTSKTKAQEVLSEVYYSHIHEAVNYARAYRNNYNTHNQFLDYFLSWGFIASVLFMIPFIVLGIMSIKNRDPYAFFCVFILLSFCLVENPLQRAWTILLYPYCFELLRIRLEHKKSYG